MRPIISPCIPCCSSINSVSSVSVRDVKVIIGDIRAMCEEAKRSQSALKVLTGELNRPQRTNAEDCEIITNTVSSRYDIKRDNDQCQTLMEKWVGPLTLASALAGRRLPDTYADLAYRYLLQNHPHDSICGCSIAQVHRDMKYRFDQCKGIANELISDVIFHHRAKETGNSWNFILNLYNPLPYERDEVVTVNLVFPSYYPYRYQERFGYDDLINCFDLYDENGKRISYTLHRIQEGTQQRLFGPHVASGRGHLISMRVAFGRRRRYPAHRSAVRSADPAVRQHDHLPYLGRERPYRSDDSSRRHAAHQA